MTARISFPTFGTNASAPAQEVLALCEAMGWDAGMEYSADGIPQGGRCAQMVLEDLRASGWTLARIGGEDAP